MLTGENGDEHLQTQRPCARLCLKKQKCPFMSKEYLGHYIDAESIHSFGDALTAIRDALHPTISFGRTLGW